MRVRIMMVAVLLMATVGVAQQPFKRPQAASRETVTVGVTAIGFSAATLTPVDGKGKVQQCDGTLEGGPIRMLSTGTNPTALVGRLAPANQAISIYGDDILSKWRAIRETTASADVKIEFECYREFRP